MQENLAKMPREEAHNVIDVLSTASREELISLGVTERIIVLVESRKMVTKYNLLPNALERVNIIQQGLEKFDQMFQPLF